MRNFGLKERCLNVNLRLISILVFCVLQRPNVHQLLMMSCWEKQMLYSLLKSIGLPACITFRVIQELQNNTVKTQIQMCAQPSPCSSRYSNALRRPTSFLQYELECTCGWSPGEFLLFVLHSHSYPVLVGSNGKVRRLQGCCDVVNNDSKKTWK